MLSCLFVYIFHTVPEKVQNLDANFVSAVSEFNTTTQQWTIDINITWSEPLFPNGVITLYNVTVYRTDNTSDVEYSNAGITVPNVTVSVTVQAYTNYTVSVAASTSAGQGPESLFTIESPEAGKTPCMCAYLNNAFSCQQLQQKFKVSQHHLATVQTTTQTPECTV